MSRPIETVLAFETSCDETAVALFNTKKGLLGQELYSGIDIHKAYGGVVPELAARDHIQYAAPLLQRLFARLQMTLQQVDGVAYTKGPGLIGALLVGAQLARSLAWALSVPSIGVHHMEAHLAAIMLEAKYPTYPYVALLISGGHTLLVEVAALGQYRILGQTLDDAAGEAFDKTATALGLPYPGGPELARCAKQGRHGVFTFPRPMTTKHKGMNFSFSGLKTAVIQLLQKESPQHEGAALQQLRADVALAFEEAVADTLRIKVMRALAETKCKQLAIVGGVSANRRIRQTLSQSLTPLGVELFYPRVEFCTDNAAMVAYLGAARLRAGEKEPLAVDVYPRWSMEELTPVVCDFES